MRSLPAKPCAQQKTSSFMDLVASDLGLRALRLGTGIMGTMT